MRVLVVSQSATERMRATSALHLREGTEVVEADSGPEVRRLLAVDDVDVLVIDGDLAPQGGFSMLYELRAQGELEVRATPPALVMMGREQDRWLAGWSGANEVLLKPVDPFELARIVSELAGDAPAQRDPEDESADQVAATVAADDGTGGLLPE